MSDERKTYKTTQFAPRGIKASDLVSWCIDHDVIGTIQPCHADVLLELANVLAGTQ